jgi:hypothetical protein
MQKKNQVKEEYSKTKLIESMAPFWLRRLPFFSFTVSSLRGIILCVGTTRRVQEEQDENVW